MSYRTDIETLIRRHQRRLQLLKEQRAIEGISADPKIVIQIEDIEAELDQLRAELASLPAEEAAPTSPPSGRASPAGSHTGGGTHGNGSGKNEGGIIARRDWHNVKTSNRSPPSPEKNPPVEDLKRLLASLQQDMAQLAAQPETLQQIAPSAPFTIQGAAASLNAALEAVAGPVDQARAKSVQQNLAEAINLLSRSLDSARTVAEQPTHLGRSAQTIVAALEPVVEKLGTASVWVCRLWLAEGRSNKL